MIARVQGNASDDHRAAISLTMAVDSRVQDDIGIWFNAELRWLENAVHETVYLPRQCLHELGALYNKALYTQQHIYQLNDVDNSLSIHFSFDATSSRYKGDIVLSFGWLKGAPSIIVSTNATVFEVNQIQKFILDLHSVANS